MKKTLKVTLSIIMTLALLVVGSPITAVAADTPICYIDGNATPFYSLSDAINAAEDGDTINVVADGKFEKVVINKDLTLTSTNGSTLTCEKSATNQMDIQGDVTISGNLKITGVGSEVINLTQGKLEVKDNVVLTGQCHTICIYKGGDITENICELVVSGGTIVSNGDFSSVKSAIGNWTPYAKITIIGGTITRAGKAAIQNAAANAIIDISGGTIEASEKVIYDKSGSTIKVSGGTIQIIDGTGNKEGGIHLDTSADTNVTMTGGLICTNGDGIYKGNTGTLTANISGGTIQSNTYTLDIAKGNATVNITGGTIEATTDYAISKYGTSDLNANVNISDEAKICASKKAIVVKPGLNVNISGGSVEVINDTIDDQYGIVNEEGNINITGGKFILDGTYASGQMIYHASDKGGTTTVDGGLFINKNKNNVEVFGTKVNYISGRVLYGENITGIVRGSLSPVDSVKVTYEGQPYYLYTRFGATNSEMVADVLEEGASIRTTYGSTGMRFTSTFKKIDGATYGTIILPASKLANVDGLTLNALGTENTDYLNIVANDSIVDNGDGIITVRAAISQILPENYETYFAAIAYAKVGDTYYFGSFDLGKNARNVSGVAMAALDDLNETAEVKDGKDYQYAVEAYGKTLYSPYTAYQRGVIESFVAVTQNVPRPTGATLINSGNGAYQYYLENVDSNAYSAYKTSLVEAGFEQAAENTLEGNVYITYTKGKQIVTLAYTVNTEMRVIMESTDNTTLPVNDETTGSLDTLVTQVGQWVDNTTEGNYATADTAGMGYVIRLEDGRFIIVDGGYNSEAHADKLYNVLEEQAEGDIVIAAWIFTHAHEDHIGTFKAFTAKYASNVTVERFIYNFPASESAKFGGVESIPSTVEFKRATTKYDGAVTIIAHAGQSFDIANAEINILFTYEMMQPQKLSYYNSCSMIFNVKVEGSTILFLGDADGDNTTGTPLADMMEIYTSATYGANIIQAAHHGTSNNDVTDNFYSNIRSGVAHVFVPSASQYVKLSDDNYVNLNNCSAYKTLSGTRYIAGSTNTVLTLDNGSVTANS